MKILDLNKSVYDLTTQYPELIPVLSDAGFTPITNPAMRQTAGRFTTILQACARQGKDIQQMITLLKDKGFIVKH